MSQDVAPPLCAGRYRLVSVLGEGGMATVYSAYDERLGVVRAIKLLTPALGLHSGLRRRFETEARTTARLHHKNIVTVHDVGTDGDRTYMVLELVGGGSLMGRVEALGPMPPRMACGVMATILAALQYAHEHGVVHRDIKPHNILIDQDGTPKLTDFGIARVVTSNESLTRTGAAIGTPAYMAPEQRGNASQVDARADLYSAGATLYALVTGREPYDLYARELHDHLFTRVPGPISAIIRNATRYHPHERYATAAAMLADLREIIAELEMDPPGTLPLGAPLPPPRTTVAQSRPPDTADESASVGGGETRPLETGPLSQSGATVAPPLDEVGVDIETALEPEPVALGSALTSWRFWALVVLGVMAALGGVAVLLLAGGHLLPSGARTATAAPSSPVPTPAAAETAPKEDVPVATAAPETPPAALPATAAPSTAASRANAPRASATTAATTARPTPAPAAQPPTSSHLGTLTVSSKPRADVFLSDRWQGRTRMKADLKPGTYHVVIESEEDGRKEVDLVVRPDEDTRYCWDFKEQAICTH